MIEKKEEDQKEGKQWHKWSHKGTGLMKNGIPAIRKYQPDIRNIGFENAKISNIVWRPGILWDLT